LWKGGGGGGGGGEDGRGRRCVIVFLFENDAFPSFCVMHDSPGTYIRHPPFFYFFNNELRKSTRS